MDRAWNTPILQGEYICSVNSCEAMKAGRQAQKVMLFEPAIGV